MPRNQRKRSTKPGSNPIPPEIVGLEFDARRETRLATVEGLKTRRLPLDVIAVADSAAVAADRAIANVTTRFRPRPALACQEGCAWCCYKRVGTTAAEVFRIIDFLRRNLSEAAFQATRERIAAREKERQSLRDDPWAANHRACPLLVDKRCTVYPVRPVTCRGYNSSDAESCEDSIHMPMEVPMYAPQQRLATFVLDGLRAGLAESGLKSDLLELIPALYCALEVPDALNRWMGGETVFGPAKMT